MNTGDKSNGSYYDILELPIDATRKEIIEAYQKAKSIYNKDSMALYTLYSDDDSVNMLDVIEEAYQVLINPHKRALYDKEHNISCSRSVASIAFDRPGQMRRTFVEVPDFKNTSEAKLAEMTFDGRNHSLLNKNLNKTNYNEIVPEYEIDDDIELLIQEEVEFKGEFFKKIRNYKNMSLHYISNKTKVSMYHIEALEKESYSDLPARVYVRGFINNYAKILGLPSKKAVDAYLKRYDSLQK